MRTESFKDFDDFASSIPGIESKMLMRAPENRRWTIRRVTSGDIEIQLGELGSGNIAAGAVRPDTFILYLPLTSGIEYLGNGERVGSQGCLLIEPGAEFCVSTKQKHDWLAAFMPSRLLPAQLHDRFTRSCRVADVDGEVIQQFRTTLSEVLVASAAEEEFESTRAASNAALEIQRLAARLSETDRQERRANEGRPRMPRQDIVRSALAFMERCHDRPVQVADLADACAVSERTVRSVFHDFYGLSPVRYLQVRKLNEVRRALKAAEPEEKRVTHILAEHGVWSFGRFASQYRKMFGESPSDTLRRPPRS